MRGISYGDGHIIFCVPNTGIKRLNISTETIDTILNDKTVKDESHIVTGGDRICYTCPPTTDTVTVLNSKYNVIFKYQGRTLLVNPFGVTVDSHNNVYVIGALSYNLLVISPDGKKVHQLLSKDDGLLYPTAVHYDCHTKQLIVVVSAGDTVHKYSLG